MQQTHRSAKQSLPIIETPNLCPFADFAMVKERRPGSIQVHGWWHAMGVCNTITVVFLGTSGGEEMGKKATKSMWAFKLSCCEQALAIEGN